MSDRIRWQSSLRQGDPEGERYAVAPVAVGPPIAAFIGQMNFTPMVQSVIFSPFWIVYFSATIWRARRSKRKAQIHQDSPSKKWLLIALFVVVIPSFM